MEAVEAWLGPEGSLVVVVWEAGAAGKRPAY